MKNIPDYMDFSKTPEPICGEPCPSHLHTQMQDAYTARNRTDADASQNALLRIQGQCCKHIHWLTTQEGIQRDSGEVGAYFSEESYNELITFIAGVGAACGEVVARLDGYGAVELDELMAGNKQGEDAGHPPMI